MAKNIKAKYMKNGGEVGKYAVKFCYINDDINVDDIVVVRSSYGLGFAVITEVEESTPDFTRPKALCVVPPEEEIVF